MANGNKVAVVSRYQETEKFWYRTLRDNGYKMMLYNKYSGRNLLPNVGREGHTYFNYIVENYDHLPDEILFTQYNPKDHFRCKSIFNEENKEVNWSRFLNGKLYDFIGIRPTDFDIEVRKRHIDWVQFCKYLFPYFSNEDINKLIFYGSNLNGVFRVSKRAILQRDLQFYKKCLDMLSYEIDPDSGYFFERMWKFIFARYGLLDYRYSFLKNQLLLFGSDQFNKKNYSAGVESEKKWKNNAYGHILLHESGCLLYNSDRLSLYAHPNETYWLIENNMLFIFDAEGSVRHEFDLTKLLTDHHTVYGNFFGYDGQVYENSHWLKPKMFQDKFSFSNLDSADPIT